MHMASSYYFFEKRKNLCLEENKVAVTYWGYQFLERTQKLSNTVDTQDS